MFKTSSEGSSDTNHDSLLQNTTYNWTPTRYLLRKLEENYILNDSLFVLLRSLHVCRSQFWQCKRQDNANFSISFPTNVCPMSHILVSHVWSRYKDSECLFYKLFLAATNLDQNWRPRQSLAKGTGRCCTYYILCECNVCLSWIHCLIMVKKLQYVASVCSGYITALASSNTTQNSVVFSWFNHY